MPTLKTLSFRKRQRTTVYTFFLFISFVAVSHAQSTKYFSIPLENLGQWSKSIIVEMTDVKITGHSNVHDLENDCELHFGATSASYKGDPHGLVLEPMNVCIEPFFNKSEYEKKDWTSFAKSLVGQTVKIEGVPRIWPEHLMGHSSNSNPNHAVEIHPLTKLTHQNETYDFTPFIYAPEGYVGGVQESTALSIIKNTKVGVTKINEGMVEIDFESDRIGNFTTLKLKILKSDVSSFNGGHRIKAKVFEKNRAKHPVTCITMKDSDLDDKITKALSRKSKSLIIRALVLFSLDPLALHTAAVNSQNNSFSRSQVLNPIQLVIYGVLE